MDHKREGEGRREMDRKEGEGRREMDHKRGRGEEGDGL